MMFLKNPDEIEKKSFEIIKSKIENVYSNEELKIVLRVIHATGDFEYEKLLRFKNNPVEVGLSALKKGCSIFTDTRMAYAGINKKILQELNCNINCFIDDEEIFDKAKRENITRAMASVEMAVEKNIDIFVIGNAPTALFSLCQHIKEGKIVPSLVIGVPVGFVGACESKELLRKLKVPSISTEGTKGGSNVAAAIFNALLYMAVGKWK
ncbi:MAG: precorrin-8X methylmutase [Thermovenabulum sp.]|uniref:precorrin-8X methylmutase n=1 Tax=Thermovenabulum sp. TaxID=3100335 RepID=UPI003C7A5E48